MKKYTEQDRIIAIRSLFSWFPQLVRTRCGIDQVYFERALDGGSSPGARATCGSTPFAAPTLVETHAWAVGDSGGLMGPFHDLLAS
jgi:hypothetical protein